jgi:hypothetical protein
MGVAAHSRERMPRHGVLSTMNSGHLGSVSGCGGPRMATVRRRAARDPAVAGSNRRRRKAVSAPMESDSVPGWLRQRSAYPLTD